MKSEECITKDKPLVCDFKTRKVRNTRKRFVPGRKIWKVHEDSVETWSVK